MQTTATLVPTVIKALSTPPTTLRQPSAKFCDWLGFKTFNDPELEKAVKAAFQWVSAFKAKEPPRWLSILGTSGTGKTYICRQLWKYCQKMVQTGRTISRGGANYHMDTLYAPHRIFWPDFIERLRGGEGYELLNDMKDWPVMFLDDIGAENSTCFSAEKLFNLLECRMGRWTLITSNMDFDGLKAIDSRITSRLIRDRNICVSVNTVDFATR